MSAVPPTPRVKLRTATRRVPRARKAEDSNSATPDTEPHMRLSRAILVMLLLHVVAVGGILAFSLVKERGQSHAVTTPAAGAVEAEDSDAPATKVESRDVERRPADAVGTLANARPTRTGDTLTRVVNDPTTNNATSNPANDAAERIAGGRANTAPSPTSSTTPAGDRSKNLPADSGKTYAVRKGDSPYTIADKFKVEASALLKLNGIDDPKKLKIGQTLRIPATSHPKTK